MAQTAQSALRSEDLGVLLAQLAIFFYGRPPSLPGIGRRPAVRCSGRQTHRDLAGRLTAAVEELRSRIEPVPEAAPAGRQDHGPQLKEAKRALAASIQEMKRSSVLPMDTHQRHSFHTALA